MRLYGVGSRDKEDTEDNYNHQPPTTNYQLPITIMELRHLRYFIAVAEELNFSRAAERLHMAQPPLSQQIRDLEAEIGVRLFDRTKRRVELTVAGRVFLEKVRQLLRQIEQAVEAAQRASRGEIGRLSLGFNSSATYSVLPTLLKAFRERCPEVVLDLHELTTPQQILQLQQQQIDAGILYLPIDLEEIELEIVSVLKEGMAIAIPETHPLATSTQISIRALSQELFVLPPARLGSGLYNQIRQFFQQTEFSPIAVQEAIQLQTSISLVAGGVGVALVPSSLQNLQRAGVIYRSLIEPTPEIEIAVAWRKGERSPILQNFIESIYEHFSVEMLHV
ncbi:LysR substrate-binding domain-containing protein [Chroococcidiopsis thermalis]|uniref:Transcriptional regulator, LysR family n=1 Tax=Chroococcidiopsis thermalis (strain PCC 7203) TaxID=251229 RepID=K9U100_CHRTP|nr:LysR substrate-binding domain-containing protein [Chroococcidiopsis thermalis]AFY87904.1 transcriptional regulator, LysR family [Chroococcidiopsis thermalis PCC 7203]